MVAMARQQSRVAVAEALALSGLHPSLLQEGQAVRVLRIQSLGRRLPVVVAEEAADRLTEVLVAAEAEVLAHTLALQVQELSTPEAVAGETTEPFPMLALAVPAP